MVKILRDDLKASDTEPGSFGRAHTSLAWSRDGRTWVRDREKFFEPDDNPSAWDHAHAWIDEQVVADDEVYLYYGGYKQGHKVNRFQERQIGLVRMPLDRYVARRTKSKPGSLRTTPIQLEKNTSTLQVNANAQHGFLRVQICRPGENAPIHDFEFDHCTPIQSDGLHQNVQWRKRNIASLAGTAVVLEFNAVDADLFAFEFK